MAKLLEGYEDIVAQIRKIRLSRRRNENENLFSMPSPAAMSISPPMNGEEPADPDYWIHLLRQRDYEHFETVVVSHLTKLIDFPDDELSRLFGEDSQESNKKTTSVTPPEPPIPLNEELKRNMSRLFQHIKQKVDLEEDGVFRHSGSVARSADLFNQLQNSPSLVDLNKFKVHDSVTVIKKYLKRIPEPLLMPSRYIVAHTEIAKWPYNPSTEEKRMESIQLLLLLLPHHYREILRGLFQLLQYTYQKSTSWKNAGDLAKAIAPSLILPRDDGAQRYARLAEALNDHVGYMILHTNLIFSSPKHVQQKVKVYWQEADSSPTRGLEKLAAPSSAVKRSSSSAKRQSATMTQQSLEALHQNFDDAGVQKKMRKRQKTLSKFTEDDARREKLPNTNFSGLKCFSPGSL